MARFDVYRYDSAEAPYVVDVQANLLCDFKSRVVVPLEARSRAAREALPRLKPIFRIGGRDYVFKSTDIAAIPVSDLGERVANLEADYRHDITAALDFLFQGFLNGGAGEGAG